MAEMEAEAKRQEALIKPEEPEVKPGGAGDRPS